MRDMGSTQKWRNRKSETLRRVELYSSAYKLAWEQISSTERRERPNIPLLIHASIRRQLKAGVTDAHLIAFQGAQRCPWPRYLLAPAGHRALKSAIASSRVTRDSSIHKKGPGVGTRP